MEFEAVIANQANNNLTLAYGGTNTNAPVYCTSGTAAVQTPSFEGGNTPIINWRNVGLATGTFVAATIYGRAIAGSPFVDFKACYRDNRGTAGTVLRNGCCVGAFYSDTATDTFNQLGVSIGGSANFTGIFKLFIHRGFWSP